MKKEIFGIKFDDLTMDETMEKIKGFVILPYSEFVVRAQKNKEFKDILNKADYCLCEGRGLYFAMRVLGFKIKENINGVELIYKLANNEQRTMNRIFLLGGTEEIVKKTAERLGERVIGYEHGYVDLDKAIDKINKIKPDILLVGLGSPKQEKFIYYNLSKMPSVKLAIGVGGAFDFISGKIKRAPKFLQKIGFEWLWRLILQPRRLKRISTGVLGITWLTFKNVLLLKSKPFSSRKR